MLKRRQAAGLQDGRDPSRLDLKQQVSDKRRLEAGLTPGDHDLGDLLDRCVILFQGFVEQVSSGGSDPDHLQGLGGTFFQAIPAGVAALMVNFQPFIALVEAALGANLIALLAVDAHLRVPMELRSLGMVQAGTAPGGWERMTLEDDLGVNLFPAQNGEMSDFQDGPLSGGLYPRGGCVGVCHLFT